MTESTSYRLVNQETGEVIACGSMRDMRRLASKCEAECRFNIILKDWQEQLQDWPPTLKPLLLPIDELTDVQLLDEFCFFCAERAEARGRNSAFNDNHLVALFGELKRRNLFPE